MQSPSAASLLELTEPRLAALYAYWNSKCAGRTMPARADLDPLEMRQWLGNLALIDVKPDGDFVYRLYGTEFVDKFGVEMTGHGIDELPPDQRDRLRADYAGACEAREPRARVYTALFTPPNAGLGSAGEPQLATWERLILPLSEDDGRVTMLLLGAYKLSDLRPST